MKIELKCQPPQNGLQEKVLDQRALLASSIFSVYNITFIEGRHTFVEEIRYGF